MAFAFSLFGSVSMAQTTPLVVANSGISPAPSVVSDRFIENAELVGPVKSFREWRDLKIRLIQAKIDLLQSQPGTGTQLRKESYSLDMAKELTMTDYFAAYLNKLSNKAEAFRIIAEKMSPEEVADLMNAYASSMFTSHGSQGPSQGLNLQKTQGK